MYVLFILVVSVFLTFEVEVFFWRVVFPLLIQKHFHRVIKILIWKLQLLSFVSESPVYGKLFESVQSERWAEFTLSYFLFNLHLGRGVGRNISIFGNLELRIIGHVIFLRRLVVPVFELSTTCFMNSSELLNLQTALIELVFFHKVSRSTMHNFEVECRVKVVLSILLLALVVSNNLVSIIWLPYNLLVIRFLVLEIRHHGWLGRNEVLKFTLSCFKRWGRSFINWFCLKQLLDFWKICNCFIMIVGWNRLRNPWPRPTWQAWHLSTKEVLKVLYRLQSLLFVNM